MADLYTPVGGRLLAELGADVVVVEPPGGARMRHRPPYLRDEPDPDRSLRWWGANVGKRSVVIDSATPGGVEGLRRVLGEADVVIEGGGADLDRLGVGYKEVSDTNPGVIWIIVTAFGRDSARVNEPVTDLTMLAGAGQIWNCGYDDHSLPPIRGAGDQSDNIAGHYVAISVLVALVHRDRTGRGQLVDLSVNAACNVTNEQVTYNWLVIQETCTRQTGRHAYYTPTAPVQVRCADGAYATTGVLPRYPRDFQELHGWLAELGLLDQLPEAVFLEMGASRPEPVDLAVIGTDDETTAILSAARDAISLIAAHLPAREFFLQSQVRGFPAGAVMTPDEAFQDEHSEGFRVPVHHEELETTFDYPGIPYIFSTSASPIPRRPPITGEHSAELLGDV